MILIVDDLRFFGNIFEDTQIIYATNSKEAIKILEEKASELTEIFLDHDLGMVNGTIDDITPVVNWIEEDIVAGCQHLRNLKGIRILTSNPVGYRRIKALERYFNILPAPKHIGIRGNV